MVSVSAQIALTKPYVGREDNCAVGVDDTVVITYGSDGEFFCTNCCCAAYDDVVVCGIYKEGVGIDL